MWTDTTFFFLQPLLIRNCEHFFIVDTHFITCLYVSYDLGAQFQYTPDEEFSL